jgi:hypothetical protein
VVNQLAREQTAHPTLAAARAGGSWNALVGSVANTIAEMPLWKLQTVGGEVDEFLYRRSQFESRSIRLLPGAPDAFRALYGLVLDAVRGAWVRQIHAIGSNRPVLGDSDLASFLFGAERSALSDFARVLREHQAALCLYCRQEVKGGGCVDHFIAWSRYPVDLGHNLVLAHAKCNAKKRDFLAHPAHIESWHSSHVERACELAQRFDAAKLPHDAERTHAIAWWAYEQGEAAGAHVWLREARFERLDRRWRAALERAELARVAERCPPMYRSS